MAVEALLQSPATLDYLASRTDGRICYKVIPGGRAIDPRWIVIKGSSIPGGRASSIGRNGKGL